MSSGSSDPCFCVHCCSSIFSFGCLSKMIFHLLYIAEMIQTKIQTKTHFHLALLFNKCCNSSPEPNVERENVVNFTYSDISEKQALKLHGKDKSPSCFHKKCAL